MIEHKPGRQVCKMYNGYIRVINVKQFKDLSSVKSRTRDSFADIHFTSLQRLPFSDFFSSSFKSSPLKDKSDKG